MKSVFAIFGILLVAAGTFSGCLNWFLTEFYLESVDWDGPMLIVNQFAWIGNVLGMGLGAGMIGVAALLGASGKAS